MSLLYVIICRTFSSYPSMPFPGECKVPGSCQCCQPATVGTSQNLCKRNM